MSREKIKDKREEIDWQKECAEWQKKALANEAELRYAQQRLTQEIESKNRDKLDLNKKIEALEKGMEKLSSSFSNNNDSFSNNKKTRDERKNSSLDGCGCANCADSVAKTVQTMLKRLELFEKTVSKTSFSTTTETNKKEKEKDPGQIVLSKIAAQREKLNASLEAIQKLALEQKKIVKSLAATEIDLSFLVSQDHHNHQNSARNLHSATTPKKQSKTPKKERK